MRELNTLPEALRQFILHWGDMGGTWGVTRTVAQIHALLYMSEQALNAEQIAAILGVARSNVSNSLKELVQLKIVRRVPVTGDRRDYYEADIDVWSLAKKIAAVRKARDIDPALETLTYCLKAAENEAEVSEEQARRLSELHGFTQSIDDWYTQMVGLSPNILARLVDMGTKVIRFVS